MTKVEKIFQQQTHDIHSGINRFFAFLMAIQWFGAILVAQNSGSLRATFISLLGGGALALPALYAGFKRSGAPNTRFFMAAAQVGFSIFFFYISGGRTESYFHIFVSLAALGFYRDIPVILTANAVIFTHFMVRGILGDVSWLGGVAWVVAQDMLLVYGTWKARKELRQMALSKHMMIEARDEAMRFSSHKSTFLSSMSHEIRTPLHAIVGFSDILKDSRLEEDQMGYVQTIHRCSESLLHLINDILDISKIESGLLEIDRHDFDFYELHEDIHKIFGEKCRSKDLKFTMNLGPHLPRFAKGDSHRLRQVLLNLVSNAIKFTETGEVFIEVRKDLKTGNYHWAVRDTGCGVSPTNVDKLFSSFFQENASISRKFGGSGLGLMISKNLVELMGGEIKAESTPGEGSTFSFWIPLEEVYIDISDTGD